MHDPGIEITYQKCSASGVSNRYQLRYLFQNQILTNQTLAPFSLWNLSLKSIRQIDTHLFTLLLEYIKYIENKSPHKFSLTRQRIDLYISLRLYIAYISQN